MMTIIGIHSWLAEKESPAFAIETKKLMSQVLMRSAQIFITDYQYYVEENYQIEWMKRSVWINDPARDLVSYPQFSIRVANWNNYFWQINHQRRTVSDWIQIILNVSSLFFDIFRRVILFVFFQKIRERLKIFACFSKIIAKGFKKFWEFSSIWFFRYDFSRLVEPLSGTKD